jgi:high-affinity nickel-transport protein
MTPLPSLVLGFALGVRHATDADHIAAIGTIIADGRSARRAAMIGAAWGAGHSASVLLVGGALVLFRLPMPVRAALALEFLAALMLIALGLRALVTHRHRGSSAASTTRPLAVGVVHGLAGSAVLALLVLGATSSALAAAIYLVCFCVGTIGGMAMVTALLALPAQFNMMRLASLDRGVRVAAGIASVGIGLFMAHRIGVRDGLFGATPTWTPE